MFCSDVLALPIFKQEESSLPTDNENKILPFQYVLCAATSPAVKLHDETLTYLNQGKLHFSFARIRGGQKAAVSLSWLLKLTVIKAKIPTGRANNKE